MTDDIPNSIEGDGGDNPTTEKNQIADAIKSLEREYRSAREDPTNYERETHRWAIITGKGVVVYSILTAGITVAAICSAWDARQSLNLTREIFKADQRPIIWLTNHNDMPRFQAPSNQITWNWEMSNYGKSPATRIHFETYMSLDGGSYILDYGKRKNNDIDSGPMPPGKIDFATVFSQPRISDTEFARLMATDGGISISGTIRYQDVSGDTYESAFCVNHLSNGAIQYHIPSTDCRNDIK
jgi:hypothetical protein